MLGTCGKSLFANIVALGAVNELTHCVSEEALEKAVLNRVPKGTEEANKKANELVDTIKCDNLFHRTDIGAKAYRK